MQGTVRIADSSNQSCTPVPTSLSALMVLLVLHLSGCGPPEMESEAATPLYELNFGTEMATIHTDAGPRAAPQGGGGGEVVAIDLNGHPVRFAWRRGYSRFINCLLLPPPATNTLSVAPTKSRPAIARVTKITSLDPLPVTVAEGRLLNGDDAAIAFEFRSEIGARANFEAIAIDKEKQRESIRAELLGEIRDLFRRIKQEDGEATAAILTEGYSRWALELSDAQHDNPRKVHESIARLIDEHGANCSQPDWEELVFAFGNRSVLVYADWRDDDSLLAEPYLFEFPDAGLHLWPLRFVRSDGKWIVWQF